ncbi:type IV-A pilus assembly ATPase PilB [Halomonas huangheensis]|uniref:Bacterial type II secretion system protein E domain-containing protein n=1 Tax=Halomonas huangheensis TaxID=1178482 RepID=W1NCK0_9GAMM|nr:type IV-A pilus assembly ATPase PilB [Halomonas huangheensis]ALM52830.1 type IV-A pilus assembly ATPase PilB [Halomonas huangheensis]ERL53254.1 hypothetical protein BJB45_18455 [Halomonas huangheensis]
MEALTQRLHDKLEQRLLEEGLLTARQIKDAAHAARQDDMQLLDHLVESRQVSALPLARIAAEIHGVPLADLEGIEPADLPSPSSFPESLLRENDLLPLAYDGYWLRVAIPCPSRLAHLNELERFTGHGVAVQLAPADRLRALLDAWLRDDTTRQDACPNVSRALDELNEDANKNPYSTAISSLVDQRDDAPVVKFVNSILRDAVRRGASDIHFEPFEDCYRVRMRIDGILHEMAQPPTAMQARVASRLKVMAQLDISERRLPQDGAIKINVKDGKSVDFRVSSLPTVNGEKVVLRLLDPVASHIHIDALGMTTEQRQLLRSALARPQGMILVTGPTGSGKTVTLYSGIHLLNQIDRNICTAEDPVEIKVPGINQLNVQPRIGLDFAQALRAFLRQDPDVVMVGEIRDRETAEIAIKAAQTGHLVLSTLHTNSAADTLVRLTNMGVAAFNVASAVSLIIAQRLVRTLCPHCRRPEELSSDARAHLGLDAARCETATLYAPQGCAHCNEGYRGRTGIFEVVPISPAIRQRILEYAGTDELRLLAQNEGHRNLWQSGLELVLNGVTSLNELHRVAQSPQCRHNHAARGEE